MRLGRVGAIPLQHDRYRGDMSDSYIDDAVDVTMRDRGDALHIPNFEVLPEYRNRGLGRQAMQRAIEVAETHGHSKVTVEMRLTEPAGDFDDDPSVQFLRDLGFTNLRETANGKHVAGEHPL